MSNLKKSRKTLLTQSVTALKLVGVMVVHQKLELPNQSPLARAMIVTSLAQNYPGTGQNRPIL